MKNAKYILLFYLIIVFSGLNLIKYNYENNNIFAIIDSFTEKNETGLLSFVFIKTKSFDEKEISKYSKIVFENHNSLKNKNDSTKILVIYYFNPSDSALIPPEYLSKLKLKYPKVNNLSKKINYYPNGYVYTSYKSHKKVKNIAKDSIFRTAVFAPKFGFKSKDILKNKK